MYKVPFRQIYCDSLLGWIREVVWCFVVMKLFRSDIDAITCKSEFPPITE